MQTNVTEQISRRVKLLPAEKQEQVLEFVESLGSPQRSMLDIIKEIKATIPLSRTPLTNGMKMPYGWPTKL